MFDERDTQNPNFDDVICTQPDDDGPPEPTRQLTIKDHLEWALSKAREYGEAWESACQQSRAENRRLRERLEDAERCLAAACKRADETVENCIEALCGIPPLASTKAERIELYAAAVSDCIDRIRDVGKQP